MAIFQLILEKVFRCRLQLTLLERNRHAQYWIALQRIFAHLKLLVPMLLYVVAHELHHLIAVAIYFQRRLLVFRCPLNVDNDELCGFLFRPQARIVFEHFQTAAKANDQIGFPNRFARILPIIRIAVAQLLAKVNYGVAQLCLGAAWRSAAAAVLAEPSRSVLAKYALLGDVKVAHILLVALGTEFDETVAVQLGEALPVDAGSQMEAVAVLRDEMFDVVGIHECFEGHVRVCGLNEGKVGRSHLNALLQHCPKTFNQNRFGFLYLMFLFKFYNNSIKRMRN